MISSTRFLLPFCFLFSIIYRPHKVLSTVLFKFVVIYKITFLFLYN
ncbi:hypothetical protein ANACOL_03952 [Anaerotruncus colihominis DSM 17241]|uniref:Uncharacterized protein n=1 Tax=Anaerotruncus colihominis DSM 17241 TaxID=445972 RepID=B0PGT3_9FIRM|nr:hypothetical protein ANACOL_03952 [Anaerotruncus colihominis DSM 17241]